MRAGQGAGRCGFPRASSGPVEVGGVGCVSGTVAADAVLPRGRGALPGCHACERGSFGRPQATATSRAESSPVEHSFVALPGSGTLVIERER